ncbi:MAG: efflux RND transporter periplasmic adaptor subunit [Gloeotrichia echinulata DEX184]|nr:efflux RND transporter periplasmic adaptor subunit [Gloeotrichia echinulata DEX184]
MPPPKGKYPTFKTAVSSAFSNPSFRTYIMAMILAWMVISIISVIPTFLVIALLKREVSFGAVINTAMIGSAIAGFAFVIPLSKKYGKKRVFQGSMIWYGVGMIIMAVGRFWFQDSLLPWLITIIISHLALASFFSLPNAILSDIIEEDTEKEGSRREAIFFGTRGLIIQFSQGFGSLLTGLILMLGKTPSNPWGVQIAFLFAGLLSLGAAKMLGFYPDVINTMNHHNSVSPSDTPSDISKSKKKNSQLPWRLILLGLLGFLSTLVYPSSRNFILERITSSGSTTEADPVAVNTVASKALPVRTLVVNPVTNHQESRRYAGNVVVKRTSDIGFEQSGTLVSLLVEEGQEVKKGSLIAILDTRNLQVQKRELLAQRAQAVAQLQELQAGPRSQAIAASKAKVRDLKEQMVLAQAKFERRQNLLKAGAISSEQLEEVRTDVKAQQARVDEAQSQVDELLAGSRPEQISLQKSVIDQFNAQIERIYLDIQKSQLKAPYSGTIAQQNVNIGTVVTSGQAIVRLVEDNSLEARIGIPSETANKLPIGSTHRLKIAEQVITGKVTSILPLLDSTTRTVTVIFNLNQTRGIRSGQIVSVELSQSIPLSGYWLPTGALVKGTRGLWSCYVLGKANPKNPRMFSIKRKDLEVLSIQGDRLLVRGTLTPGDQVIIEGADRIVADQMVQVW